MRILIAALGLSLATGTGGLAAPKHARDYIILGAEDGEVFAMHKGSIRKAGPQRVDAKLVFVWMTPRDVEDAAGKKVAEGGAYSISDFAVDCRKTAYSPVRTTYFAETGTVLHVEEHPAGGEGWMNEVTTPFVKLACSAGLRETVRAKRYSSMGEFVTAVRKAFEPDMSVWGPLVGATPKP